MQHDLLKWLQEVLLEVEACELFLDQKLICELSQGVDSKNGHIQILVRANMDEMLAEHLPNACPDESDSCHVQISDLNKGL